MTKNIKIIFIFFLLILITSCGFKRINDKDSNKIFIQNINIVGEQRIAYLLKNNISLISNSNSKNKYNINLKVKKRKTNKIKNTTGKVERYNLSISINLQLINNDNKKIITKTFNRNNDYDVATTHSATINNENIATRNTIQQLSEDVIYFVKILMRKK
mgnify:CR=1 FL=1